jgi:drug/metabolite transporter (DMT)-like permease
VGVSARSEATATSGGALEYVMILMGSTFLMGSSFVAGKILLNAGVPALLLVGFRFLVAALGTLGLVAWEGGLSARGLVPVALSRADGLKVVLIGVLQTGAVMGLLFLAMREIPAPMAALLLFTNPIWVALFARVFLGEALPARRALGLLLGAVGVALALQAGGAGGGLWRGQLIALGSALCWAAATLVNKRANLKLGVWALSFWQMLIGAVALLAIAYLDGERWPTGLTASHWGWFGWLALPGSTGSFGLWFMALRRGGATRTSGYLFLAPLFAAVLSHWVLGSSLSARQLLGGLAIGLGIWLVNREVTEPGPRGE